MNKKTRNILLIVGLGALLIAGTKIIDDLTDTHNPELDAEKEELVREIEELKGKFRESERERIKTRKENQFLKKEIEIYEIENDTTITIIRDAARDGDHAKLDSIGDSVLDKIKRRRARQFKHL